MGFYVPQGREGVGKELVEKGIRGVLTQLLKQQI